MVGCDDSLADCCFRSDLINSSVMRKIILFLFFIPNMVFASFPVLDNCSDTIRKNGKVYIQVDKNLSDVQLRVDSLEKINRKALKKDNDIRVNRKRNTTILGSIGVTLIWVAALAAALVIAIFYLFIDSLNS